MMDRTEGSRQDPVIDGRQSAAEVAELRRKLAEAEERNLNLVDAVIGAEAAAAQARRDIDEIFHRLDVRETELKQLKELLGFDLETPLDRIARSLDGRPTVPVEDRG